MPEMLASRRLQAVSELRVKRDLSKTALSEELLQEVLRHQGLKVLDLGGTFCKLLTTVEPRRLARALTKMEEVNLTYAGLTWCHQAGGRCKLSSLPSVNAPTSCRNWIWTS